MKGVRGCLTSRSFVYELLRAKYFKANALNIKNLTNCHILDDFVKRGKEYEYDIRNTSPKDVSV